MKNQKHILNSAFISIASMTILLLSPNLALADRSPAGCTGSGLGIDLSVNESQAHIGDILSYSIDVFNGISNSPGPIVCDASDIVASLTTPDGQVHPITLLRTTLSNGQIDSYQNVVTYTARTQDVTSTGSLTATAVDTGTIHQNINNSQGGSNQGVSVNVLAAPTTLHIIKTVVNTNGNIAIPSNFNLHVKNAGVDVIGSPAPGAVSPGTLYTLSVGTYVVSEDASSSYTKSFSGACDSTGTVTLVANTDQTCTITNTSIANVVVTPPPPIINNTPIIGTVLGGGSVAPTVSPPPSTSSTTPTSSTPIVVQNQTVIAVATPIPVAAAVVATYIPHTPTVANTGMGGEATVNIALLILSTLVFLGGASLIYYSVI